MDFKLFVKILNKILILGIIVYCPKICSGQEPETNLKLVKDVFYQIIDESLAGFNPVDSSALIYKPTKSLEYNWLIEHQIIEIAQQKGFITFYQYRKPLSDNTASVYDLTYEPVLLHVEYRPNKSLTSSNVERLITCELGIKCVDENSQVVASGIIEKSFSDIISSKDIKLVENSNYFFTIGEKNSKGMFGSLFEPIIISAITGGIIYSFYSYRSK